MLPLALLISEIFNLIASKLELDLSFSAGKTCAAGQCPPNLKNFGKVVIVPLCPLEHDLEFGEQEGDQFGGWDRSLVAGGLLVAWTMVVVVKLCG